MKAFKSCLFPVFQTLYGRICSMDFNTDKNMLDSYKNSYFPKHLISFISSLQESNTPNDILLAVINALSESNNCNLCNSCQKCASQFYISIAELLIPDIISDDLRTKKEDLEATYGKLSFRSPPLYLVDHFNENNNLWENYIKNKKNNEILREIDNCLIILKGMSSASPYIYNEIYTNNNFTGGGLYIRYHGVGIAIDPGYGFVENMRQNKISIQDIDVVIITHWHIDHNNDMRILDDLNHQFQRVKHTIKWYIDSDTHNYYYHNFDDKTNVCQIINPNLDKEIIINDSISFLPFNTQHIRKKHEKESYENTSYGFVMELKKNDGSGVKIGYTSDTRFFDGLAKKMLECKIVIANISGIYLDDYLLIKQKDSHLGYNGCFRILQALNQNTELFIVSEFWNGTSDLRIDVCKSLDSEKNNNVKIVPGDVGLHIDYINSKIKCTRCGKFSSFSDTFSVRPNIELGNIEYICNGCFI